MHKHKVLCLNLFKEQHFKFWIHFHWQIDFSIVKFFYPFALTISKERFIVKNLVSILESFCLPFLLIVFLKIFLPYIFSQFWFRFLALSFSCLSFEISLSFVVVPLRSSD